MPTSVTSTSAITTTSTVTTTTTQAPITRPPVSETGCSAAGLAEFRDRAFLNLPWLDDAAPPALTRQALIEAAIACDFETLVSLAWADVPENAAGWGTFWDESHLRVHGLQHLDATQNALWDLAVALIYTEPYWEFSECEDGGTAWHCDMSWYQWPATEFSPDQLQRPALLDGTTPQEFSDRLRNGYLTFGVVISDDGRWMAAYAPAPVDCEGVPGSATDRSDEPDWSSFYLPWTSTLGCLVRVDVVFEALGEAHCDFDEARHLLTGEPLGTRFGSTAPPVAYIRDPTGVYGNDTLTGGFAELGDLPADAIDSGFRLRDRELWTSPGDPGAIYIKDSQGVERWPRGNLPSCL